MTRGRLGGLAATVVVVSAATLLPAQQEPRPFQHEAHRDLSCLSCHTSGGRHGVPKTWTAADCASCHHREDQPLACAACHDPADRADRRESVQEMWLSVWEAPRSRELPFEHPAHEGFECRDCHESAPELAPRTCASCHEDHVEADVECAQCHRPTEPGVHGLVAHLSCAGSGCHSQAATERPMLSRPSCLVCHDAQRDHRTESPCVRCHFMSGGATRAPTRVQGEGMVPNPTPLAPAPPRSRP